MRIHYSNKCHKKLQGIPIKYCKQIKAVREKCRVYSVKGQISFEQHLTIRFFPPRKQHRYIYKVSSRGSSVSIVSGYGLDDRAIEIRSSADAKGFFL
jgi:hypothetical protein